jgi:MFS family permease
MASSSKLLDLNLNPDERTLKQFGFIALGGFGLLAACAFFEKFMFAFGLGAARQPVAITLAALALVAALFSLIAPKANKFIYVGITVLAFPIGFVMSYVIMGTLFFLIFAPVGAMLRVAGTDPMQRALRKDDKSYWSEARPQRSKESYFRQF